MSTNSIRVHIGGTVAYVPQDKSLWALFPNGLMSAPARWNLEKNPEIQKARASHFALLIVDQDRINECKTTGYFSTIIEPWKPAGIPQGQPYPLTKSRKAIALIEQQGLDFGFPEAKANIGSEFYDYVPDMKIISRKHRVVDRQFLPVPGSEQFDYSALSCGLRMNTGDIIVESYYKDSTDVDFGYVKKSWSGKVRYKGRVWKKPIASHVSWEVDLGERKEIVITSTDWASAGRDTSEYVLNVPDDGSGLDVALIHTEMETISLFLGDPLFPDGIEGFPDPDFELIYTLSSKRNSLGDWRVPIPSDGTHGLKEKPCSGGQFEGFSK